MKNKNKKEKEKENENERKKGLTQTGQANSGWHAG